MGNTKVILSVAVVGLCLACEVQAGLVYYQPFEDGGTGSLANLGTAGGSGTLTGTTTYNSSTPNGSAWSMQWPSSDNGTRVTLPSSAGQFTRPGVSTPMTLTAWVSWSAGKWSTVASKGTSWDLMITGDGRLRTQFQGGSRYSMTSQGVVQAGTWNQVAMVIGAGQQYTFYINGRNIGNDGSNVVAPYSLDNTNSIQLGAGSGGWDGMQGGSLDDVGLFDSALTDGKMKAIYSLATAAPLHYGLGDVNQLFGVYDARAGSVTFAGTTWSYATGLSVAGGLARYSRTAVAISCRWLRTALA